MPNRSEREIIELHTKAAVAAYGEQWSRMSEDEREEWRDQVRIARSKTREIMGKWFPK